MCNKRISNIRASYLFNLNIIFFLFIFSMQEIFCCNNFIYFIILILLVITKIYFNGPSAKKSRLDKKIIIITGASDGIGRNTAEELLKSGAKVIYACRNEKKTNEIISNLDKKLRENAVYMNLNLSSLASVNSFVNEIKRQYTGIDVLINNAGIINSKYKESEDNIEETLQVNTISHMYLTQELLELLNNNNGKVINVSSLGHKYFKLTNEKYAEMNSPDFKYSKNYNSFNQYNISKLGNVYFTQYLQVYILKNNLNIGTYSLHPGVIITEISRDLPKFLVLLMKNLFYPLFFLFFKSIEKGAQTTLYLVYEDKSNLKSGEFYKDCCLSKTTGHCDMSIEENRLYRDMLIGYFGRLLNRTNTVSFKLI